jgi:hypothetical protein
LQSFCCHPSTLPILAAKSIPYCFSKGFNVCVGVFYQKLYQNNYTVHAVAHTLDVDSKHSDGSIPKEASAKDAATRFAIFASFTECCFDTIFACATDCRSISSAVIAKPGVETVMCIFVWLLPGWEWYVFLMFIVFVSLFVVRFVFCVCVWCGSRSFSSKARTRPGRATQLVGERGWAQGGQANGGDRQGRSSLDSIRVYWME